MAQIVKECIENAMDLSVPFPVKVKTGPSWGQLLSKCVTMTESFSNKLKLFRRKEILANSVFIYSNLIN